MVRSYKPQSFKGNKEQNSNHPPQGIESAAFPAPALMLYNVTGEPMEYNIGDDEMEYN